MLDELIQRIRELTGAQDVHSADAMRAVGIDSLTYVQLVVETEQKYKIEFADNELILDDNKTIAEFVRSAEEKCKRRPCAE